MPRARLLAAIAVVINVLAANVANNKLQNWSWTRRGFINLESVSVAVAEACQVNDVNVGVERLDGSESKNLDGKTDVDGTADEPENLENPVELTIDYIVDNYSISMFHLAKSIVHDQALAEDVVQESLVKTWRALASFRGESSLKSWVLRITRNTAISMARKRREVLSDPALLPEGDVFSQASPERQVDGKLAVDDLWVALANLDELSRSVVILREIEGLTYDEIALALDIALPTVKTRLFRARRVLSSSLKEWT